MKVIYADTLEELSVKSLGLHHDHCYHYYYGETKDIPIKFEKYIKKDEKCCFLYKEDEPSKYI